MMTSIFCFGCGSDVSDPTGKIKMCACKEITRWSIWDDNEWTLFHPSNTFRMHGDRTVFFDQNRSIVMCEESLSYHG